MSNSKSKLSIVGSREPFGRVTRLEQIPSAMFEILCLARELKTAKGNQIATLVDDVISVALEDPEAWVKFKFLAENEYRKAISGQES
jgi:hypothetical protein